MSKKSYLTVYAVGRPGGKTVHAGKPIELTEQEAERLIEKGAIAPMPEANAEPMALNLLSLPDAEFEAAIAGMKLDPLKSVVASLGIAVGEARTKADFIALITSVREAGK